MAEPAKILLIIPNLNLGGAQRVFHQHSIALARHYEVREAVFSLAHGHAYPSGNPIIELGVGGGGGILTKLGNFGRRVARLRALNRSFRPDIIISHLEGADFVSLLAGGPGRRILCIHGSKLADPSAQGIAGLARRLPVRLLYNRADRIVTVSRDLKPELVAMGVDPARIETINNGFNLAAIRSGAAVPLDPADAALFGEMPVLVTVGRLAPQKNHARLLAAFAALRATRPARLILVGDGDLRGSLVAQARALGLIVCDRAAGEGAGAAAAPDVVFTGARDNPFNLLRAADLFVLSSDFEGFPLALCEAMASGCAVASADCPTGPREILSPDSALPATAITRPEQGPYGVLLPLVDGPAGARCWAEAIAGLIDDPAERARLTRAGHERIAELGHDRTMAKWVDLIDRLCAQPSTSER
jgi:glycosyltransferase involved in cell wall biosynthesis